MVLQKQNKLYLSTVNQKTNFLIHVSMETTIEHNYHNEWLIVVTYMHVTVVYIHDVKSHGRNTHS